MRRTHTHAQESKVKTAPAPLRPYAHLMPTLFDRLRDDNPRRQTEQAGEISVSSKELLQIIQRDLSYLLNTVNASGMFKDGNFPEAGASTLNYGIAPLAGGYLLEKRWRHIEQMIRKAILAFEPRLIPESLNVVSLFKNDPTHYYNTLQFEIRGLARTDPHPIEFLVQSSVDLETNHFSLSIA
jgi:type VI secretion system protein ImpF